MNAASAAPPPPRRRGLRRWLLALALPPLALLLTAALALWWMAQTERGSVWALQRIPGLELDAPRGTLLGDFAARRLSYRSGALQVELHGLRWRGLSVAWVGAPELWTRIAVEQLQVDRASLRWPASSSDAPAAPPQDLTLPLVLELPDLRVGELQLPALSPQPLRELQGGLWLGEQLGGRHRVELRRLAWDRLQVAGTARIGARGELPLQARLQLSQQPAAADQPPLQDWRAEASLEGPLATLRLQASASAGESKDEQQRLQLQTRIAPFAPWPLAEARLELERFDLAALHSALPATRLSGRATLESSGWERPARARAELRNALAGRWDQQRLPLQHLTLDLEARPDRLRGLQDLEQLKVHRLEALLGSPAQPGGRLSAEGSGLQLQARLAELRSGALDARLPPLQLQGDLRLQGRLPAQGGEAPAATLSARLDGSWQQSATLRRPVALQLEARTEGRDALRLERASLSSGSSQLSLQGRMQRPDGGAWRAELSARAQDFDPRLLWAGPPRSAWALGQHSVDASLQAVLDGSSRSPWPRGQARLDIAPSLLAGLGLSGRIDYQAQARTAPTLSAELQAGDNRIALRADSLGQPRPRGQAEIDAPRLAALSPLLALLGGGEAQLAGSLKGQLAVLLDGGEASSSGRLEARSLQLRSWPGQAGPLALAGGALDWQLDSRPDAPLRLDGRLEALSLGQTQLQSGRLALQGSWASHRLNLEGRGRSPAPAWARQLGGATSAASSAFLEGRLALALQGQAAISPWQAWLAEAPKPLAWRGRIEQLQLRPGREDQPAWLATRDLGLALQLGPDGAPLLLHAEPGRLELAGAMLRWSLAQWQAPRQAGEPALAALDLALEPLQVAPLLARWQPDFGWGGDLALGGRVKLRSQPRVEIEAELKRAGGDLSVTEGRTTQKLGLTELHLNLQARDGVWQLAQGLAGSNLGVLGGAITVRSSSAQRLWPEPGAPLQGALLLNVENLATWGAWVPAGWRLGGAVQAHVQIGGKLGAPEIVGSAGGSAVELRNPLQGVDIREGSFALDFDGLGARLERLSARAGEGRLTAEGSATLGERPRLDLQLKAEQFRLLSRVDRRLVVSGDAALALAGDALKLSGKVGVDEGLFDVSRGNAPTLDDDVQVLRAGGPQPPAGAETAAPGTAPVSTRRVDMQLDIDLGRRLRVRGHGIDTRLRGELKLSHRGGGAGPLLDGTVSTLGGTYDAYGQKLEIEKGEISFAGALDNPRLDVLAVRPNTDVRVGVTVTGTALSPRIKLYSDPEMADTDKLSWLLLGRAPEGLGRADTALLQRAALALLSGEGESASGRLIRNLGLDELSVGQDDSDARGTVVRVGKQLTRRWYVAYERGLNATAGSWQLIYRAARRFTLRAQAGEETALDLIWQWKWD